MGMGSRQLRKEISGNFPETSGTPRIERRRSTQPVRSPLIWENEWPSSEAVGCLGNEAPDFLIMQILRLRRTACGLNFPTGSLTTHEAPKAKICSRVWRCLRTSAASTRATCFPSELASSEDGKMQSIVALCCWFSWEGQPFQYGTLQPPPPPNLPPCAT